MTATPTTVGALYVHAPFCARRCFYCDFAVHVRRTGGGREWLDALAGELDALSREGAFRLAGVLDSVFVGGGTPSLLEPACMGGLAALVGRERLRGEDLEWTVEANPESFTDELARAWRAAGVNRLSLGVQTFHEPALRWMGRLHGADGAYGAVAVASRAGFDNLSLDLIFGLPSHLGRSWSEDLARVVELAPRHVSLYGLSVEEGTALGRWVREGRESVADEEQYREEYLEAASVLTAAGYHHYEVSNFARPGAASRHNRAYWDGTPYLGLGNGAHSYRPFRRRWNLRSWEEYREAAAAGRLPLDEAETLDAAAQRLERIWLALRTEQGLSEGELGEEGMALTRSWTASGWARVDAGIVRLTPEGWLLLDELATELDGVATRV